MLYARRIIFLILSLSVFGVGAESRIIKKIPRLNTYLIGTYTDTDNHGIELLSFDKENMMLNTKVIASGIKDPSFVITNLTRKLVFAVEDTENGKVSSFSFDQNKQSLILLSKVESLGDNPCFIALDNSERFLAVANYTSGNFSVYEVDSLGRLHFKQSVQHTGSSIDKQRQNNAYVHSIAFHPNGKQMLVADLGTDKIHIYDINFSNTVPITRANPAFFKVVAGSGPRHMVIHPNGKMLYLVHELTGEIGVYFYEAGKITHINTHSLTPSAFKGHVQAAEVRISPDGKFIYVSNRGSANNLSVFELGLQGELTLLQQIATGGQTPRNFNLSLDGEFLLVGNEESNDISVFKRDILTGLLKNTSRSIYINKPVYIFPFQ